MVDLEAEIDTVLVAHHVDTIDVDVIHHGRPPTHCVACKKVRQAILDRITLPVSEGGLGMKIVSDDLFFSQSWASDALKREPRYPGAEDR